MPDMQKRLLELRKTLKGVMASADQRLEKGLDSMPMLGPFGFLPFGTECVEFFDDLDEVLKAGMRALEPSEVMADPSADEDIFVPPPTPRLTLLIKCVDLKGYQGNRVLIEDLPHDEYSDELMAAVEELPPGTALVVRDPYHFSRVLPELTRYASKVIQG